MLNALQDEAVVLPTSGSRGCTAAVVELRFIIDMVEAKEVKEVKDKVSVYCGEVQFIT